MTVISARLFLPVGLAMFVSLALAGCGNAGSGSALKNSAFLTPPPLQETKQTASLAADKPSGDLAKTPKLAVKRPAKGAIASKVSPGTNPIITVKSAGSPPMPVRRPYRKVRKKLATRMIKDQKPIVKLVKKTPAKLVATPKIQARAKPAVTTPVVVEAPKVEMVPVNAVAVQVSPKEAPEMILDGFIDGSGINSSHQMSAQKLDEAKMAQAQSVAEKPNFGQSEFRFSSQK